MGSETHRLVILLQNTPMALSDEASQEGLHCSNAAQLPKQ